MADPQDRLQVALFPDRFPRLSLHNTTDDTTNDTTTATAATKANDATADKQYPVGPLDPLENFLAKVERMGKIQADDKERDRMHRERIEKMKSRMRKDQHDNENPDNEIDKRQYRKQIGMAKIGAQSQEHHHYKQMAKIEVQSEEQIAKIEVQRQERLAMIELAKNSNVTF